MHLKKRGFFFKSYMLGNERGGGVHDPYTSSAIDYMGILILGCEYLYITSDTL
jgi:hypothetical protein